VPFFATGSPFRRATVRKGPDNTKKSERPVLPASEAFYSPIGNSDFSLNTRIFVAEIRKKAEFCIH
jgi:hypothetical protein